MAKQVFGEYYLRVKENFVERAASRVISFVELRGAEAHMACSVSPLTLPLFCNELDSNAGGSRTNLITLMTAFEHDQKPHDILRSSFTLKKPTAPLPNHLETFCIHPA